MVKKIIGILLLLVLAIGVLTAAVKQMRYKAKQTEIRFMKSFVKDLERQIPAARWSYTHAADKDKPPLSYALAIYADFDSASDFKATREKIRGIENSLIKKYDIVCIDYRSEYDKLEVHVKEGKMESVPKKSRAIVFYVKQIK
ncbi:MAG TPA: hypothetical protein PL155_09195 [Candidatus Omnitrophota bacterium]|nr:hypothetical protein [Candidatus Omnitrophota bacterium]HPD85650.1 hypothetical protein [Candidatus Omnitrophota bacterium]HRZ04493.1 hypothetical protein [Candidatus Omnitrophota bacterium]